MDLLYTDDDMLVLNKPAGLPVLPDGWDAEAPYLVKMLEQETPAATGAAGRSIWVVHRLDKSTSGVMVFARNGQAHRDLNRQFELHEARKVYHAIFESAPEWKERTARHPLRVNVGHKHRTAVDPRHGKPSETTFRVLQRFAYHALVEALPLTGRTHQIRAHAYALGIPLLGDVLYGGEETSIIARPALHAHRLTISHPTTGEVLSFTAPYPNDFSEALEKISG